MQNRIHSILTNHDTSVFMKIYLPVNIFIKEGDCNAFNAFLNTVSWLVEIPWIRFRISGSDDSNTLPKVQMWWLELLFSKFYYCAGPSSVLRDYLKCGIVCEPHSIEPHILTAVLKLLLLSIRIATNSLQTKQRLDLNNTMFNLILYPTQPFPQVKKTQSQLDFCLILLKDIF